MQNIQLSIENEECVRAVLAAIITPEMSAEKSDASLDELERLLETAGGEVSAIVTQSRLKPDTAMYLGKGKIDELAELVKSSGVKLVIFDGELTPSQIRNIEDELGGAGVQVIDRSMLILEIFAEHARTAEGKLQVEIAMLRYTAPRLTGHGNEMSRLGGGGGGGGGARRGSGESKLEIDRRNVKSRIAALTEELEKLEGNRYVMRSQREKAGVPNIAIAGYTNAGKSTLLNHLTGAGILAEDKLFATLDPTTRKLKMEGGREVLFTDTVGFIRNLPHHLVKAFKSTLDEVRYADAVLVIADASDPQIEAQLKVTRGLLSELGAEKKPVIYALNKCDRLEGEVFISDLKDYCTISAKTGEGVDELLNRLTATLDSSRKTLKFAIPNSEQGKLAILYKTGGIVETVYGDNCVEITAVVDDKVRGQLSRYIVR